MVVQGIAEYGELPVGLEAAEAFLGLHHAGGGQRGVGGAPLGSLELAASPMDHIDVPGVVKTVHPVTRPADCTSRAIDLLVICNRLDVGDTERHLLRVLSSLDWGGGGDHDVQAAAPRRSPEGAERRSQRE